MPKLRKSLLVAVVLLAWPAWAGTVWTGKIIDVLDGDSIIVRQGRAAITVRLWGVDCPEWRQPYGQAAKAWTAKLVGRRVKVEPKDVNRYGRVIGRVYLPDGRECEAAEDQARRKKIGLWSQKKPTPPWKFRRNHRK